nr:amino acid synthesis family protein [Chloroflexia bacterium]
MTELEIHRLYAVSEEVWREGGREVGRPVKRAAVAAVIANPLAGQHGADLDVLIGFGEQLGDILTRRAVALLGEDAGESFGKAAIVGLRGELEHAAALLHPKFGAPMRAALGGGAAIIPSAKKMGGPGDTIDVPLHYKDAA